MKPCYFSLSKYRKRFHEIPTSFAFSGSPGGFGLINFPNSFVSLCCLLSRAIINFSRYSPSSVYSSAFHHATSGYFFNTLKHTPFAPVNWLFRPDLLWDCVSAEKCHPNRSFISQGIKIKICCRAARKLRLFGFTRSENFYVRPASRFHGSEGSQCSLKCIRGGRKK